MKLQPDGVVVEPAARQPGPLDGVLAFLDVLFRRAALIVKGDDALSTAREVGHDKADARVQLTWMPLDWTLLTKVETSCDRILIAGGANVEAEWEQGPAV